MSAVHEIAVAPGRERSYRPTSSYLLHANFFGSKLVNADVKNLALYPVTGRLYEANVTSNAVVGPLDAVSPPVSSLG